MANEKPAVGLRRPNRSVESFVSGLDEKISPAEAKSQNEAEGAKRARMTIYLSPELARKLRVKAAADGAQISNIVEEALRDRLGI